MPKNWTDFEKLVAEIQRDTAADAEVVHDERIVGKSGRVRQIDIAIRKKIGLFPVLIAIECKLQSRAVSIGQIEAFVTKLRDVDASEGVFVSNQPFSAGARAQAQQHRVRTLTVREALDTDWKRVVGEQAWFTMLVLSIPVLRAITPRIERTWEFTAETPIAETNGQVAVLAEHIYAGKREMGIGDRPGEYAFRIDFTPACLAGPEGEQVSLDWIAFEFTQTVTAYVFNLELAEGNVVEDAASGAAVYSKSQSKAMDWHQAVEEGKGVVLSPEQYDQEVRDGSIISGPKLASLPRFLRVEVAAEPK